MIRRIILIWITVQLVWQWAYKFKRQKKLSVALVVKNQPAMQKTWVQSLDREDPLEERVAIHSSILAWRIPWTEDPDGLQSIGSQRIRHNGRDLAFTSLQCWGQGSARWGWMRSYQGLGFSWLTLHTWLVGLLLPHLRKLRLGGPVSSSKLGPCSSGSPVTPRSEHGSCHLVGIP